MPPNTPAAAPPLNRWSSLFGGIYEQWRGAKQARYRGLIASGYIGPRIVAEGDSWLELPSIGYATDLVRELWDDYAVYSLARAGDTWADIDAKAELMPFVAAEMPDIAILSVGGNEILGEIERYVGDWTPGARPADLLRRARFKAILDHVIDRYRATCGDLCRHGVDVIVHGYAHGDPRWRADGGNLIGDPLSTLRGINSIADWREIVRLMLGPFNERLAALAADPAFAGKVHYLDLRPRLDYGRAHWQDEVHPSRTGFGRVRRPFKEAIDAIWQSRQVS